MICHDCGQNVPYHKMWSEHVCLECHKINVAIGVRIRNGEERHRERMRTERNYRMLWEKVMKREKAHPKPLRKWKGDI